MPVFGLGTWKMGENRRDAAAEIAALRQGLDLGVTMIDTAEMYGDGGAEVITAEAIKGRRDTVFLVSKVYPHHAGRPDVVKACEQSLKRLGTDVLDLYLVHWRGRVPLEETARGFEDLQRAGKIRDFGVSNFDVEDMDEWSAVDRGLTGANQVYYSLGERGIETRLLPWCRTRGIAVMAYSPLDQGTVLTNGALCEVAADLDATPAQVALAWLMMQDGVSVIPKSANVERVRENCGAVSLRLPPEALMALERAFPPPRRTKPLAMT